MGQDRMLTIQNAIYITQVDQQQKMPIKKLVDATYSNGVWTRTNASNITADETALLDSLDGLNEDNEKWDLHLKPNKDYIVIDRGDVYQTAWSRANKWVNFATINKMQELIQHMILQVY